MRVNLTDNRLTRTTWRVLPSLQSVRTRLFEIAVIAWSIPFGLMILSVFQIVRPPWLVRRALRLWSLGFVKLARHVVGVRYRVQGREGVPDRPVIFVCNHQSYWESIALTAFLPNVNVISKAEAMDIPVFGWGLRHAPMTPIHRGLRGANLRRMAREARQSLSEGRSVVIFPEGKRVEPGRTSAYLRGLSLMYETCDTYLVPVAQDAGRCWTKGFETKKAGLVTLRFCEPIPPGGSAFRVAAEVESFLNREKEQLSDS